MEHVVSGMVEGLTPQERKRIIRRLRWLTRALDSAVRVPGTTWRLGLDPLLGLVPGAGDVVSAALSVYMILEARRLGASRQVLVRMAGNVALDLLAGSVPVVGDLFDFAFKANARNWKILEQEGLVREE